MRPHRAPLRPLFIAALLGLAAPLLGQYYPAPKPAMPPPATPPPATAPGGKAAEKPAAPAPKIEGVAVQRANGTWVGLAVEGGNLKLRFYDKDKKPAQPDAARAAARWSPIGKTGEQRVVLNPAGDLLTAPQFVSPPLIFRVFITLLSSDDKVIESFSVDLREL